MPSGSFSFNFSVIFLYLSVSFYAKTGVPLLCTPVCVLSQRGYRQLTNAEEKYYEKFIEASKSPNPKQAFIELSSLPEGIMPETIIEDVFKELVEEHPLLDKINFNYAKYMTKWVLNDHTLDTAVWGELNSEIAKQITSAFKIVDITQNKLSAFAAIPLDMLDLGPTFLDAYIRAVLKDAIFTMDSTSSAVNGSKYSLSAISKSVETVSGLLLIMTVSQPSFANAQVQCTEQKSNSIP